jgi:hypothetical protein
MHLDPDDVKIKFDIVKIEPHIDAGNGCAGSTEGAKG